MTPPNDSARDTAIAFQHRLIEQLRSDYDYSDGALVQGMLDEAADLIEQQEREIERLRLV